jgi:hypothetical protein
VVAIPVIGAPVDEFAADALREADVPPHTAKVVGTIAGALV